MLSTFTITVIMLFISVRIWKEFAQVLNRLIFYFQGTYPVSVNVLAVITQSRESSEIWIQSVQY